MVPMLQVSVPTVAPKVSYVGDIRAGLVIHNCFAWFKVFPSGAVVCLSIIAVYLCIHVLSSYLS